MKVAILLTGHSTDFNKTFDSLKKNILDVYDCDIYFNTWDVINTSPNRGITRTFNIPERPLDKQTLIEKYQPYLKNYNFESWDSYTNNRFPSLSFLNRPDDVFKVNERAIYHGSFWVEKLRDQWWMIQRGWRLIENPQQYNLILKTGFDLHINQIQLKKIKFVVPKSEVEFYKIGTYWSNDMAYGDPDNMEKYCNMFNHIERLYTEYNIDVSHAEAMSEFYMREYGHPSDAFIDLDIQYNKV
jgi:hypothetical protein